MNEEAQTQAPASGATLRAVEGRVISDRMDKTVTVVVERQVRHPIYKKYIRRSTKLHVHDEKNECRVGDTVLIRECRPISRTKSWRLESIVSRPDVA